MAMRTAKQSKGKIGRDRTDVADYFRFLLRMPPDMARKLDALAKEDYSPMNSYILRMLRDGLRLIDAQQAHDTPPPQEARRVS